MRINFYKKQYRVSTFFIRVLWGTMAFAIILSLDACTTDKVGDLRAFSSSASLAQFSVERLPSVQVPDNFYLAPAKTVWSKVRYENFSSEVYKVLFHQSMMKPSDGFTVAEKTLLSKVGVVNTSISLAPSKIMDDNTPYTKVSPKEEQLLSSGAIAVRKPKPLKSSALKSKKGSATKKKNSKAKEKSNSSSKSIKS